MTMSNRDRAEIAVAYGILHGKTHEQIVDTLDADGLLIPDLPEPDNGYPEWLVGGVSISPGLNTGEVDIEWEDRMLRLAPGQALAFLAAYAYAERNQA